MNPRNQSLSAGGGRDAVADARGGFLGTTAKSSATLENKGFSENRRSEPIDPETGEISSGLSPAKCRIERYALQSVVRRLLPDSRTAKCLRWRQQNKTVQVWKSTGYDRAHYQGLQTCASVWTCPVCSAKISERRRAELLALIEAHQAAGGVVVMVTRTVPHKRADNLGQLLDRFSKAEKSYKGHRDYKTVMRAFGLVGTVRAIEVTHGYANGWHPHVHELVFLAEPVSLEDLEEDLSRMWAAAALRAGLDLPSREHGLTVQDGSHAAKYASKWGLESEMTQWHRKRGAAGSRTPFDLLRDVAENDSLPSGHLFREYAAAFHGRRQLVFSPGLKARYHISEVSDEELIDRHDEDAFLLGSLDLDQWRTVCQAEARGVLLEVAANGGWDAVLLMLAGLEEFLKRRPLPDD